jgi:hypothetical protein
VCPNRFRSLWYVRRKLCTYLASRLSLSRNGPKRAFTCASSPWSTAGCVQNDFWAYGTLAQIMHLSCTDTNTVFKWTKMRFHDPRHLEIHRMHPKWIFAPMVCSTQTVHLSCIMISTISKQTEWSFHLSLVTYEYHRVRPKQYLSLWYVWLKQCTYLAPMLTLSPNEPKQDSTWPTSPSSIRCVQNNFRAYVRRELCTYLAPTLTLSPNGPKRDSAWPISPRSYIGCVQTNFRACGTFNANRSPILHQNYHYL